MELAGDDTRRIGLEVPLDVGEHVDGAISVVDGDRAALAEGHGDQVGDHLSRREVQVRRRRLTGACGVDGEQARGRSGDRSHVDDHGGRVTGDQLMRLRIRVRGDRDGPSGTGHECATRALDARCRPCVEDPERRGERSVVAEPRIDVARLHGEQAGAQGRRGLDLDVSGAPGGRDELKGVSGDRRRCHRGPADGCGHSCRKPGAENGHALTTSNWAGGRDDGAHDRLAAGAESVDTVGGSQSVGRPSGHCGTQCRATATAVRTAGHIVETDCVLYQVACPKLFALVVKAYTPAMIGVEALVHRRDPNRPIRTCQ